MAMKAKRIPKRIRELAALRQRVEDIYSGVLECDVRDEISDDTPTLCRCADEWEKIIRALRWTLGVQLKDLPDPPKGFEWGSIFESYYLSKFCNPETATEHLYSFGIRA